MQHFRPHLHPQPRFEGYYTKFDLPSGAHVILIVSSVPRAAARPHMGSFTYVPAAFPDVPVFQREIWAEDIRMVDHSHGHGDDARGDDGRVVFELHVQGVGVVRVHADDGVEYAFADLDGGGFEFRATMPGRGRTPWVRRGLQGGVDGESRSRATPEGWLVNLPLPLHWHVHTLSSRCTYALTVPAEVYAHLDPRDVSAGLLDDPAYVHQEKNWAYSFPASHVWVQARRCRGPGDDSKSPRECDSGVCIAGGSIIGTESYLITYHGRDPANDVSYAPPYASALAIPLPSFLSSSQRPLKVSPTLTTTVDWPSRTFTLTLTTPLTRLCVSAVAPTDTFVGLSAPFHDGHRENFLAQSFRAEVRVQLFRAGLGGFGHWACVEESVFQNASLEFGGEWYGDAGKARGESRG